MIWVIGGTSESIEFFKHIKSYGISKEIVATVISEYSKELIKDIDSDIEVFVGRLDSNEMESFLLKKNIKKVIDLSHPYAKEVSKNAVNAAKKFEIEYFRFHRKSYDFNINEITDSSICNSIEEITELVEKLDGNILVTLGGNCIEKFRDLKNLKNIYFRILPDYNVIKKCFEIGVLPKNIIALQGPFSKEMNKVIIKDYSIKHLITKNSGINGGEKEKIEACLESQCKLIFLKRPDSENYGEIFFTLEGLVEKIMEDREII